ncbi:MAG: hypothetical protein V1860_00060 [bacterium]
MKINRHLKITGLIIFSIFLRFGLIKLLGEHNSFWVKILGIIFILALGVWIIKNTAEIIEETSEVLHERTKLAGGMLHAFGTAFPDMALGVVAAITSLGFMKTDYSQAISFAIIAAATTFGSNIYNIGYALWCVFRQNSANKNGIAIPIYPLIKSSGTVAPIKDHLQKPALIELDTSMDILCALTVLTAVVALSMVLFGQKPAPANIKGDLYQLIRPVGFFIFILSVAVIYAFRKSKKTEESHNDVEKDEGEEYYRNNKNSIIWLHLLFAGIAIIFAASGMVQAIKILCDSTGLPFVIAGVLAGLIGCLAEMIGVHNMTVNPRGRIGDAVVGVAMDNIITTLGASVVAIIGGIFLGGTALILIFVIILTLNTVLIWQISKLKNYVLI